MMFRYFGNFVFHIDVWCCDQYSAKLRLVLSVILVCQVPQMLEICLVPITSVASQYPALHLFSTPARMMRPVLNLAAGKVEMIGTFEQVSF